MVRCPRCSASTPTDSRFCPACGRSVAGLSMQVTEPASPLSPPRPSPSPPSPSRAPSSHSAGHAARFAPGTILLERYRIVGLLGRGGMGEIYRADDLKLDQPIALKFLPRELARDPERLESLYREVRVARQVSHANVCRTYDIADL